MDLERSRIGEKTGSESSASFRQDVIRREDSLLMRELPETKNSYEREMFLTCRISGLVPAKSASLCDTDYLVYRTEGWYALKDSRCPRPVDEELLSDIQSRLRDLYKTLKSYLLSPEHLVLEPDLVFVNENSSFAFIYRPGGAEIASGIGPGGAEGRQVPVSAEEAERIFMRKLRELQSGAGSACLSDKNTLREEGFPHEENGQSSPAQSQWDDYCQAADPEDEEFPENDSDERADKAETRRRLDFYTIAVTLFLISVMLAVFMILKSGALDQLLQYIPVIGGGS